MEEKKKRNRELYEDYKSGRFKTSELIAKYNISLKRLYDIIRREEKKLS